MSWDDIFHFDFQNPIQFDEDYTRQLEQIVYETKLDSSSNGVNQPVPELCLKADLPF